MHDSSRRWLAQTFTFVLLLCAPGLSAFARTAAADAADANWASVFVNPGLDNNVNATANLRDTLVVAGSFTHADGEPVPRVARWYGGRYHAMAGGFNGPVTALAIVSGTLYAAGDFDSSGSRPIPHVARWTGSDWAAVGTGGPNVQYNLGLAVDGTNLLLLGNFSQIGSPPVTSPYIVRWNGSAWQAMSGLSDPVSTVARVGTHLYAAGLSSGGNALFDWNGASWASVPAYDDSLLNFASFTALASYGGALIAAGDFTRIGGVTALGIGRFDGTNWTSLAGVAPNGAIDYIGIDQGALRIAGQFTSVPGPHVATWNGISWTPSTEGVVAFGGQVVTFTRVLSDLYYGGSMSVFKDALGQVAYSGGAVRFDGTKYRAVGNGHALLNVQSVSALQMYGNTLIAGGTFTGAVDHSGPNISIAAWDGNNWAPVGLAGLYGGFTNSCNSLTVWNNQIVAVGSFSSADGVAVNNIARWDGSAWHDVGGGFTINPVTNVLALGSQLIVAGGYGLGNAVASGQPMGDVARWTGTQWITIGSRSGGILGYAANCIGLWNGKAIYGSSFTSIGGVSASNIAAWNGTNWSALGAGLDGLVVAVGVHNNELYATGNFTHSGATVLPGHIARWNGSAWVALASGFDNSPSALCSFGGKLYATGVFLQAGGQTVNGIAAWDGSTWSRLGSGLDPGYIQYALAGYGGGLYVGGSLTTAGGKPASGIALWLGGGTVGVEPSALAAHLDLALAAPWPNPSRAATRISFRLPADGRASVTIVDLSGRRVRELANSLMAAGTHELQWDGRDADGVRAPAGVYWALVRTDAAQADARITLLR